MNSFLQIKNFYSKFPKRNSFLENNLVQLRTWQNVQSQASAFPESPEAAEQVDSLSEPEEEKSVGSAGILVENVDHEQRAENQEQEQPEAQQQDELKQQNEETFKQCEEKFGSSQKSIADIKPFRPKFLQQSSFNSEFYPSVSSARESTQEPSQSVQDDPEFFFALSARGSQKPPVPFQDLAPSSNGKSKRKAEPRDDKSDLVADFKQKYKTEMCKNFMQTGRCEFEESCSFAHGEYELQSKQHVHNNYKTKPCKRYHQQLVCPYGTRCQFLHSEYVKAKNIQLPRNDDFYQIKLKKAKERLLSQITESDELGDGVIFEQFAAKNAGRLPIFSDVTADKVKKAARSKRKNFTAQRSCPGMEMQAAAAVAETQRNRKMTMQQQ